MTSNSSSLSVKAIFNKRDYLKLMIVDNGVNHDSTAVFQIDYKIFVNQNDCKIIDKLLYLVNLCVDYYFVQFSGAAWYSVC